MNKIEIKNNRKVKQNLGIKNHYPVIFHKEYLDKKYYYPVFFL